MRVLCGAARGEQGNNEGILVGGHAALTGGAVTATIADGSAAWYNPAGLAKMARQSFDLNASVVKNWMLLPTGLNFQSDEPGRRRELLSAAGTPQCARDALLS